MEKITKENEELSASGESSDSADLTTGQIHSTTDKNLQTNVDLVVLLRDRISQFGTTTQQSQEQREQELSGLLLLFIQVKKTKIHKIPPVKRWEHFRH